jgi:ACS family hexuronate transporter-like MFS transporter
MLRSAKQPAQSGSRDVHWYFVAMVTAAMAVSYFDRQTVPVAICDSADDTTQRSGVSWLQFAFLISYAIIHSTLLSAFTDEFALGSQR